MRLHKPQRHTTASLLTRLQDFFAERHLIFWKMLLSMINHTCCRTELCCLALDSEMHLLRWVMLYHMYFQTKGYPMDMLYRHAQRLRINLTSRCTMNVSSIFAKN